MCFPSSSASVDSSRSPSRPPCLGVWFARISECCPLAGEWRLHHPPSLPRFCCWKIVVIRNVLNWREVVQCWRMVYMHRNRRLLTHRCCVVVLFQLLCFWAFFFMPRVRTYYKSVWILLTFYPLLITFIVGPCSWHPCQKLIGPRNHALPLRIYFLRYFLLSCPTLVCCNFLFGCL